MKSAWDRAVAAERRRCERKGFIFDQPSCDWREEEYGPGDLVKLGNVNGPIATYRVGPTGRIARVSDAEGGASMSEGSAVPGRVAGLVPLGGRAGAALTGRGGLLVLPTTVFAAGEEVPAVVEEGRAAIVADAGGVCSHCGLPLGHDPVAVSYHGDEPDDGVDDAPVMTPLNPRWADFTGRLAAVIRAEGCDAESLRLSRRLLRETGGIDVEGSLAFFRSRDGYCDCEVRLNVGQRIERRGEEKHSAWERTETAAKRNGRVA